MSTNKGRRPYARIAITLPPVVLAAADRRARRLDRSRSWVIAEAIRRFVVEEPSDNSALAPLREHVTGYQAGPTGDLGTLRLAQLEADLRLTPEQRVVAAEDTGRLARMVRPATGQQLLVLDRPEDYLCWKRQDAAGA